MMKWRNISFFILLFNFILFADISFSQSNVNQTPIANQMDQDETLSPGNLLDISFPDDRSLSRKFRINPQGFIQLPDVGRISTINQTLSSLREKIILKLASIYKNPNQIHLSKKNNDIYVRVMGLVVKPGYWLIAPDSPMQLAITKAGGLSDGAQMNQIQLHHQGTVTIVDYKKYLDTGNSKLLPTLSAMDEIFVPSSVLMGEVKLSGQLLLKGGDTSNPDNAIKVFGQVTKPGSYAYNAKYKAIDYLLRAGGTTQYAATDLIKIIDNNKALVFNLKAYLDTADIKKLPPISPGATIFVPIIATEVSNTTPTVYVMGQVQKPGSYELGKNVSFIDALANAGGPNQYGDSRKIRLIKFSGKIIYFDMQAFLDAKSPTTLPDIEAGDVIYVPLRTDMNEKSWLDIAPQRAIRIMGAVLRPGRYDWSSEMNILDLISNVGGPTKDADTEHVRILPNDNSAPIDFNLKKMLNKGAGASGLPSLKAGYTIFVPEISQTPFDMNSAIKIFGEVYKPGSYVYNRKYTAIDYLIQAGGTTHYASPEQIKVIDDKTASIFNLKNYLDTGNTKNMPIVNKGATIFIPVLTNEVKKGSHTVYVMGQVQKPGAYELGKDATFMDALANAGGPNQYAEARKVRIIKPDGRFEPFNLQAYTEGLANENIIKLPAIHSGDVIYIPIRTDWNEKSWLEVGPNHAVKVIGAVNSPGRYEWSDEMSLMDILAHAGGPNEFADTSHIRIITDEHSKQGETSIEFNLHKFIEKGGDISTVPVIKAGYTIDVPFLPRSPIDNKSIWTEQSAKNSIYVFGEVGQPGRYNFNSQLNFLDILSAANGPTANADMHDVHVIDRQGIYPQVVHVNLSLYFETGDAELLPKVLPGDAIYLPHMSKDYTEINSKHVVKILGEIAKPGRYRYTSNMTIIDLLSAAGGPTTNGLVTKILVVNIGPRLETKSSTFDLLKFSKTGNVLMLPTLREGDIVYVPNKSEDIAQRLTMILQNLANAAVFLTVGRRA